MAKIAALMTGGGGSAEMTVETYTGITGAAKTYNCTMKNGVYLMHRTDNTNVNSYVKGYVKDGTLTNIYTYSGFSVSYDPSTNQLTVSTPQLTSINTLYFFIFD